jgi:hypothetical protein
MRKVQNVFAFFKSTLAINIAVSILFFYVGGLSAFISIFLTLGFVVSLAIKEIYNKSNYIFYFNNGLSKLQLWLFSYFITVIVALVFSSIIIFLKLLF